MKEQSFLGTGWGFPPTFNNQSGTVETVSGETDVFQSLNILVSTQLKERVMRSDFGCDLTALLYENTTITLLTKIKGILENAIVMYEPRVDLIDIVFYTDDTTNGFINIELFYRIRATNSRKNFVFPYYLEEGTFIKQ